MTVSFALQKDSSYMRSHSLIVYFSALVIGVLFRKLFLDQCIQGYSPLPLLLDLEYLFVCFFKDLFFIYMSALQLSSDTHQKNASDPITDRCEPLCGCWELNSGRLEDQSVLLTSEPSLQTWSRLVVVVVVVLGFLNYYYSL